MKGKKILSVVCAAAMTVGLCACGSSSSSTSSDADSTSDSKTESSESASGSIQLLNGKPEIDDQLQSLAKTYEKETGVKVEVQTVGGSNQATASDTLKKDYQAGTMPDIFVCETNQFANWDGMLADLSDQDWVKNTDYAYTDDKNGTIGFPCYIEGWGISYNADVLEKAGIDPSTLTSPDAYKTAFETLDSKKDELGISEVVDYGANNSNLGWSTGTHLFGAYLDGGLAQDDTKYIDMLNDGGQIDEARMKDFADFIALIQQYCNKDIATNGTYDDETAEFAQGKAAFVTQGSWFGANLSSNDDYKANPFKCGIAPFAFEDGMDTICGGATGYWAVYKDSKNVDAAKAFLQWCSEDEAQKIFVEECGFNSPFKNITYTSSDPFAEAMKSYKDAGKFSGLHTFIKKDGLQNETGQVFEDFAKGSIATSDDFVSTIKGVIENYYAN